MKNFVQPGEVIAALAPYALLSGEGALVGSLFGVASADAANGAPAELVTVGVFTLKAATADVAPVGTKIYWDNTAKQATVVLTANSLIGVATVAKAAGPVVVTVRLNGVSV